MKIGNQKTILLISMLEHPHSKLSWASLEYCWHNNIFSQKLAFFTIEIKISKNRKNCSFRIKN